MNGLTSSLNGKLALRQPPREISSRKARLALAAEMPASEAALRILLNDPLAAVNVLKRANEAFYGLRGSVGSLSHAIEIVGAESCLRQLAESTRNRSDRPAQQALTRHASVAAQIAHRLANGHWLSAEGPGLTPGMVATTGLLHNIGRLAFCVSLPMESDSLYGFSDSPFPITGSISELEQLQFGINHVELGGFILHHLHLPSEMQTAVRSHRCTDSSPSTHYPTRLAWMVGASCLLAEAAGYGLSPQVSFDHTELESWSLFFDGHASLNPGEMMTVREEMTSTGTLILDDDAFFASSHSAGSEDRARNMDRPAAPRERKAAPTNTHYPISG